MRDKVYLVMNRSGVQRMTRKRFPITKGGEAVFELTVNVDNSNFEVPVAKGEITLEPDQLVLHPEVEIDVSNWEGNITLGDPLPSWRPEGEEE